MTTQQAVEAIFATTPYRETNDFKMFGCIEVKIDSYTKHQNALKNFGTNRFELHLPIEDEKRKSIRPFDENDLTMQSFVIKYMGIDDEGEAVIETINFEDFLDALCYWFQDPIEAFVIDFCAFCPWSDSRTTIFEMRKLQEFIINQRKQGPMRQSKMYARGKAPIPSTPYKRLKNIKPESIPSVIGLSKIEAEIPPLEPESSDDE